MWKNPQVMKGIMGVSGPRLLKKKKSPEYFNSVIISLSPTLESEFLLLPLTLSCSLFLLAIRSVANLSCFLSTSLSLTCTCTCLTAKHEK